MGTSGVNESDIDSLGSDFSDDFQKNELDQFKETLQKCDNLMTDFEKNCQVFLDYEKRPKIWFGSRTHQQVDQIMEELKSFGPIGLKVVVLGSKTKYCVNEEATKNGNIYDNCSSLREKSKCSFDTNNKVTKELI